MWKKQHSKGEIHPYTSTSRPKRRKKKGRLTTRTHTKNDTAGTETQKMGPHKKTGTYNNCSLNHQQQPSNGT